MAEQTSKPKTTAGKTVATFTYRDETFTAVRKPSAFLLAKLSRTDTDDPAAMGVLVEFFKRVLSPEDFSRFERTALEDDSELEDGFTLLGEALQEIVSQAFARPTK